MVWAVGRPVLVPGRHARVVRELLGEQVGIVAWALADGSCDVGGGSGNVCKGGSERRKVGMQRGAKWKDFHCNVEGDIESAD